MKLPRFTLRDMFWLVLVVGMGLGWWLDRTAWQIDREALLQAIYSEGYYPVDDSDAFGRIYWLEKK